MKKYAVSLSLIALLVVLSISLPLTGQGPVSVIVSPGVGIQQGGSPQGVATTLNCSTNLTCSVTGAIATMTAAGIGGGPTLQTNGVNNGSQALLNLQQGSNVTLTDNGLGQVTIASSGGGGGSVAATTFASLPGTCTSGALYLFTNSAISQALCGASNTYTYYAPAIGQITPPVIGSFSAVNSPTTSTTNGGIVLTAPASASDNYRMLMQNVPAAPYTTTACLISGNPNVNYLPIGIGLYDGTKLAVITVYNDASAGLFGVKSVKFNSVTSFSGYYNTDQLNGSNGIICLRIQDTGAGGGNLRNFSYSMDNVNFYQITSVSNTDFLTPTKIGLVADSANGSFPSTGWFINYATTNP